MQPRKLNLYLALPCYGGNGGVSSEHPDVRRWFTETILWAKSDPRIESVSEYPGEGDTPITMVRNRMVLAARRAGADVLVMCDSDQAPNFHAADPGFKPFMKSSFDFLYDHYDKGPVVVAAPYRGNPPHENVFVFDWEQHSGDYGDETLIKLDQYTRREVAKLRGIQNIAAAPTGLIMCDMRIFALTEPCHLSHRQVLELVAAGKMSISDAERNLSQGWFYYQWKDGYGSEKASTEDVTFSRDIAMAGQAKLGYNPLFCNWDSPIGHWKPWCVPGRPKLLATEQVAACFRRAVEDDHSADEVTVDASQFLGGWEKYIQRQSLHASNGNGRLEAPCPT